MTFLAILALLSGIFLVSDGAFRRGLLVMIIPNLNETAAVVIRLSEIVVGGLIFFLLGQLSSKC
jgi:hypothetical protein